MVIARRVFVSLVAAAASAFAGGREKSTREFSAAWDAESRACAFFEQQYNAAVRRMNEHEPLIDARLWQAWKDLEAATKTRQETGRKALRALL